VATLDEGTTEPKETPSDAIEAAKLIAKALQASTNVDSDAVDLALREVQVVPYPRYVTSPGDDPSPRLSAL
jgi:hypothetical protein